MRLALIVLLFSLMTVQCNGHLPIIGGVLSTAHKHIQSAANDVAGTLLGGLSFGFKGHKNSQPPTPMKEPHETIVVVVDEDDRDGLGPPKRPHDNYQTQTDSDGDSGKYENRGDKPSRPHQFNNYNQHGNGYQDDYNSQHGSTHHHNNGNFNHPNFNHNYPQNQGPYGLNNPNAGFGQNYPNRPNQGFNDNGWPNKPSIPNNPNQGNFYQNRDHHNNGPFNKPNFPNNPTQGNLNQDYPQRPNQGFNGNRPFNRPFPNNNGNYGPNSQGNFDQGFGQTSPNSNQGQFQGRPIPPNHQNNQAGFNQNAINKPNQISPLPNQQQNNSPSNTNNYDSSTVKDNQNGLIAGNNKDDYPFFVPLNPEELGSSTNAAPKRDTEDAKTADDDELFPIDVRLKDRKK